MNASRVVLLGFFCGAQALAQAAEQEKPLASDPFWALEQKQIPQGLNLRSAPISLDSPIQPAQTNEQEGTAQDSPLVHFDRGQITASLKLDKSTIMMGEPMNFAFVVKNASDIPLWVLEGGDYRNALGRPDSFKITVLDEQGHRVPQPDAGFQCGGIMAFQELPAHGEKRFALFLPHWATFERPGHYSIQVERVLVINSRNLVDDIPLPGQIGKRSIELRARATAELEVIPLDGERLGKLIDKLGAQIVELPPNHYARQIADQLLAIHDERTIPWLIKMLKKPNYEMKFYALRGLAEYNDRSAFEGLKEGLATTENECSNSRNIVHAAAHSLSVSPYAEALPFLLTQAHHPEYEVRLTVTHALGHKVPKAKALPMLEKLAEDQDPMVSSEAKRYLKELQTQ